MQSQFLEMKSQVAQIIGNNFKIISQNKENNHLVLVELQDSRRVIVDLTEEKFYSTKTLDAGIQFEGTGHMLGKQLTELTMFVPKYTGYNLTLRIMKILNLTSEVGWSVVNTYGNWHLIHYNDDADMTKVGHLRGVLVDVYMGLQIVSSFGYTPTVCTNELVLNDDDEIKLVDDYGVTHTFGSESMIKRVYDGMILRCAYGNAFLGQDFESESEVIRITHKNIRPIKSRWGNSPFFTQMYKEAGGPLDSEMFDLSKKYSPMCFVFLVVHPKLLMATRQQVSSPYVVLLSINQMWNPNQSPFPIEDVELECKYTFGTSPYISADMNKPFVHFPEALSLQQANKHLLTGYYDNVPDMDLRQLPGESLILYKFRNGKVVDIVKVNSLAYQYRFNLRNNDASIYHQFYNLVNHSYTSLSYHTNYVEFKKKFMLFNSHSKDELVNILEKYGKILHLAENEMSNENRKDRSKILEVIWLNYVHSLPFNMQLEATSFLERFIVERDQVTRWLQAYEANQYLDKNHITERGVSLISSARNTATSLVNDKKNLYTKPQDKYEESVKSVIKNFCQNEYGTSLYALVKKMKNIKE